MDAPVPSYLSADACRPWSGRSAGTPLTDAEPSTAARCLLVLSAMHLLAWTLLPILSSPNAPLDVIEMIYWGSEWEWGYYKHPPLPAWIAAAVTEPLGGSIWPVYVASQLFIIGTFAICWRLAREVLEPWSAAASVAALEFCFFYNFASPEFNNNVPPKFFWAASIALLYFAVCGRGAADEAVGGRHRWANSMLWAGAGASLGLAMLSKYDAAVLVVALLGFTVVHPRGRRTWRTLGPWLTTVAAIAIFLPHAIWMWKNDFPTLRYFAERTEPASHWLQHLAHPLDFVASQLLLLSGVLVALAVLFRWRFTWRELDERQRFARTYLAFAVLGPPLIVFVYSMITGGKIRSAWGSSMWGFLPLLIILSFRFDADPRRVRRLVRMAVIATVFLAVVLAMRNILSPHFRSKPSRVHFPGAALATAAQRAWSARTSQPLPIVAGDWWYAGNIAVYGPGDPSVYTDLTPERAPWTGDAELRRIGGLIVWPITSDPATSEFPESWKQRFPEARPVSPAVVSWQTSAEMQPLRVGMAIIAPPGEPSIRKPTPSTTPGSIR